MKRALLLLLAIAIVSAAPSWAEQYQVFNSTNSSLPNNLLYCLNTDRNGNIWFGGQKNATTGIANVSMLAPDLLTWKVYEQNQPSMQEDRAYYIAVDNRNNKWFCTHYGVAVLRADGTSEPIAFTNDKYTRTVQTDSKGNVYISVRETVRADSRIYVTSDYGQTWTPWGLPDLGYTLGPGSARPEIYDLREDSKGQLWICTWFGVSYRKLDGAWKLIAPLEGKYTYAMTIDRNDHVWVPDNGSKALYQILPDETIVTHDSTTIKPLGVAVLDLEADCNGHIWCATQGRGLLEIIPGQGFKQYTMESTNGALPSNTLTGLEIHCGVIWLITSDQGAVRVTDIIEQGGNQVFNSTNSSLPNNLLYCLNTDRNGNIWFGGQKNATTGIANVSMLAPDLLTWKVYEQNQPSMQEDRAYYIAVDNRNNKWFCTHYGVAVLRADGTSEPIAFTNDKYTRTVQTDSKGNVYISVRETVRADSRIYVTSDYGQTWTPWGLPDLGYTLGPGSARPEIYDLREDSKGQLWICTWFGVSYRKLDGAWKLIAPLEGKYTYAMTIDRNDHVWVPDNGSKALYQILPDETIVTHDSTTIKPLGVAVLDLEADCNGHIWCATQGRGLLEIIPGQGFKQYTMESTNGALPSNTLTGLEIRCGVIWLITGDQGAVRIADVKALTPTTGVSVNANHAKPAEFRLSANYPNPFNPCTRIRFAVQQNGLIDIRIFSITGNLVRVLSKDHYQAGSYELQWDGRDEQGRTVPSGLYVCRMQAQGFTQSIKMTLLK